MRGRPAPPAASNHAPSCASGCTAISASPKRAASSKLSFPDAATPMGGATRGKIQELGVAHRVGDELSGTGLLAHDRATDGHHARALPRRRGGVVAPPDKVPAPTPQPVRATGSDHEGAE
jgi:hypothetical protein